MGLEGSQGMGSGNNSPGDVEMNAGLEEGPVGFRRRPIGSLLLSA